MTSRSFVPVLFALWAVIASSTIMQTILVHKFLIRFLLITLHRCSWKMDKYTKHMNLHIRCECDGIHVCMMIHYDILFSYDNYALLTLTLPSPSTGVSGSLDSYCSLKPLCSGMGEVVLARRPYFPHPLTLCCHYPVSKCCSASIVVTSTVRVKRTIIHAHVSYNIMCSCVCKDAQAGSCDLR